MEIAMIEIHKFDDKLTITYRDEILGEIRVKNVKTFNEAVGYIARELIEQEKIKEADKNE